MRILYIDIDSLRADHLGCYGYVRETSPTIDAIAARGIRFTNCYASDMPCAPSRMALFSGRFGYHNGVVSHFGRRAEPHLESSRRGFRYSPLSSDMLPVRLSDAGMRTATMSPFAARHGLFTILAGFNDCHDPGGHGHGGDELTTNAALDWLDKHGTTQDWFLHVNLWDVHIPYRASDEQQPLFTGESPQMWMTQDLLDRYVGRPGYRSFMDTFYARNIRDDTSWQPAQIASLDDYCKTINGYDTMIRFADERVGQLLNRLEALGISDDTAVVIAADHGEDLGENGAVGHGFASHPTGNVPLIVSWPGVTEPVAGAADGAFRYHLDLSATLLDLLDLDIPQSWDSESFAHAVRGQSDQGRDHLVLSHLAQSAQRSVRFDRDREEYIYSRTWNDILHDLPERQLFNLSRDPHMLTDVARMHPDLVKHATGLLRDYTRGGTDPLGSVLEDAAAHYGPGLSLYKERLRETGRERHADGVDRYLQRLKRAARRPRF